MTLALISTSNDVALKSSTNPLFLTPHIPDCPHKGNYKAINQIMSSVTCGLHCVTILSLLDKQKGAFIPVPLFSWTSKKTSLK